MSEKLPMSRKNTTDIMCRLDDFCDLLEVIYQEMAAQDNPMRNVICAVKDLITCICRDFQGDIDCAELEAEKKEVS